MLLPGILYSLFLGFDINSLFSRWCVQKSKKHIHSPLFPSPCLSFVSDVFEHSTLSAVRFFLFFWQIEIEDEVAAEIATVQNAVDFIVKK